MELKKAIMERVSIRRYLPTPVPREDLEHILNMAILGPSAGNAQMWHFIVITKSLLIKELAGAVNKKAMEMMSLPEMDEFKKYMETIRAYSSFFEQAPALIAVLMKPYHSMTEKILSRQKIPPEESLKMRGFPGIQSIGAAIQNLLLAAWDLGYGTCWMTGPLFAKKELEKILEIKKPDELVALIPVGRPAETPAPRPRKPLSEVSTWIE
ncbi:MAG: nitroreductase family protein [Candidatus Eremiobacteraeota bacterium]|nr:nitroreductase family protein [Candidatus Eremiobacteraeota bacterium]